MPITAAELQDVREWYETATGLPAHLGGGRILRILEVLGAYPGLRVSDLALVKTSDEMWNWRENREPWERLGEKIGSTSSPTAGTFRLYVHPSEEAFRRLGLPTIGAGRPER